MALYASPHVALTVEAGIVRTLRATIVRYPCDTFGDVGPLRVSVRLAARVGHDGRFARAAGPASERVTVSGVVTRRSVTGLLRVRGTIGTGERCASRVLRFSAPRHLRAAG